MGFDIFLSYSRVDQAVADEFFKAASKRGLTLWYDQLLQGGEDWRDGIVKALSQSKVLVILFSDASNSSIQLIKELAVADSVGKTVIPVLIENTEPKGAYLYELAARNWIRLYPNPIHKMDELVSTIEVHLKELTGTQGGQATVNPAPPARRAESSAVASVAWIPFKTYDALFLLLLAVNALCHASGITYGSSPTPAGWNIVLI